MFSGTLLRSHPTEFLASPLLTNGQKNLYNFLWISFVSHRLMTVIRQLHLVSFPILFLSSTGRRVMERGDVQGTTDNERSTISRGFLQQQQQELGNFRNFKVDDFLAPSGRASEYSIPELLCKLVGKQPLL